MKKILLILIASIGINFYLSAQSAGDYRSVANGNWNDATKWEMFNGSSWVAASTYPGQNPGTGAVTINLFHEVKITASVPHPVASISTQIFFDEWIYEYYYGTLSFGAESSVSLAVAGNIDNSGILNVVDESGSKSHQLFIGGSLNGSLNAINGDDNLNVIFNSTLSNVTVTGGTFHDVTFNGSGFIVQGTMSISGVVAFIRGIVSTTGMGTDWAWSPESGLIHFQKGASWSGASSISHVDGWVSKEGNEAFTFPIGDNEIYAPLTISAPLGSTERYLAMYRRASGSDIAAVTDPGLFNVSNCEYWNLTSRSSNGPLDITVGWNSSSSCDASPYIINVPGVTLARFNGSWSSHGGVATGTSANGSITWSGVTGFNANYNSFTFGNVSSCKTPSGLSTTNVTGNSATITWSPEPGAVSYDVYYNTSPYGAIDQWINTATATASTAVNLSGLNQASRYSYRVRANCSSGSSSFRQSEFTTLTVCERPTGLTTTNIANFSATFNWLPVPGATGYLIELGRGYGNDWISINGVITSTSYTVSGLSSTYYTWRVRAICPEGYSHYQNSGIFWVPYSYCEQPTWLTTTNITNNSATLNWAAVTNASNYNVEYKHSTSAIWVNAATGITSLSYTLNGLSASTGYDWRVLAICFASVPGNYTQSSFTTLQEPPPTCNDVYEINNSSNQAAVISIGNAISAAISSASDIDWFKVTTPNNSNTNLDVRLTNLPADYDLYVYNKSLKLVGSSATTGTSNEVVMYNSKAKNATYYIKVVGNNGAYNASQCYALLAQALTDGSGIVSHTSVAVNEVTEDPNKELLYPNPASDFLYLNFNSTKEELVNLQIVNSIGQLVRQHPVNTSKGQNQVKIRIAGIRPGMYILKINQGDLNITRKFVIAR